MIDKATVERIKETANIVDVVSEFVTLRKSGINYKGLCPFHDEKTPSFIVSPTRGTCHCFGCGRGGNPIGFIMEHEQMTYPEALRWLAKKYHIEIHEREFTDEERREQSTRESMFILNEWASDYFHDTLLHHPEGQAIGLQYFRSRGFRDDIVEKFKLGYDLPDRESLAQTALSKGYQREFLLKNGLCYQRDDGKLIDRFAGRVIFPWVGVSGKIVGFGGRLLDARTKGVSQKYVNSPDSDIYHKDRELYGIFQAKRAIAKEDCVYMVEGYTDVLSMHQCGIENVVANSGTALSLHQIRTLHRFTSNIVLLYDGDEAGIHAAMRGTDMLLAEGMNLRVVLFPNNEDPDSFARSRSAEEFRLFIAENQTDFIRFKTRLLLDGVDDPSKRSEAISSIVKSISVVSNPILRDTYLHECALHVGVNEVTLINTMNRFIQEEKEKSRTPISETIPAGNLSNKPTHSNSTFIISSTVTATAKVEELIIRLIMRSGEQIILRDVQDEDGNTYYLTVAQYIHYNFSSDGLSFSNPLYNDILVEASERCSHEGFVAEPYFLHHDNLGISRLAAKLCQDALPTMKDGNPSACEEDASEQQRKQKEKEEKLFDLTTHLLLDFRMDIVDAQLKELKTQIAQATTDPAKLMALMSQYKETQLIRNNMAKMLRSGIIV